MKQDHRSFEEPTPWRGERITIPRGKARPQMPLGCQLGLIACGLTIQTAFLYWINL